jgi:hypothetical protein
MVGKCPSCNSTDIRIDIAGLEYVKICNHCAAVFEIATWAEIEASKQPKKFIPRPE